MLARLFTRRWLLASALVLLGAAVLVRLGFWQLDRLEWRRSLNARVVEQQSAAPLQLDPAALDLDLYSMEYRRAIVRGQYLPQHEIVLRNQIWPGDAGNQLGVDLYTPLLIEGSDLAILVERGWIPQEHAQARGAYLEDGTVSVTGQLRRAETDFGFGRALQPDPTLAPGEDRLEVWNNLDLERLAEQMDVELLPVYLQRIPEGPQSAPPYAAVRPMDLSEGSHFGYAMQWFIFAGLLLAGYPFFVRRQEAKQNKTNG
ncbi:MAG: SURF1 family protein [Anaerolineales bacterium]|nr:SURF1 family protein [Anaerolineales bacterium]